MTIAAAPHVHPLDHAQLARVAEDLAARASTRELIRFEDARVSELVHVDHQIEAWPICWRPGHDTGFHDHDGSDAVIHVIDGSVREERMGLDGGAAIGGDFGAGASVPVDAHDIHRKANLSGANAVTLHVYSPPLRGMGAYERGADGRLRRAPLAPTTTLTAD